jgi:hypothetical protein
MTIERPSAILALSAGASDGVEAVVSAGADSDAATEGSVLADVAGVALPPHPAADTSNASTHNTIKLLLAILFIITSCIIY